MSKLNPKKFPLKLALDIESAIKFLRNCARENDDTIEIIEHDSAIIYLEDLTINEFYFYVHSPTLSNDKTVCILEYNPKDESSDKPFSSVIKFDNLENYFNRWIEMLKVYNNIKFTEDDRFQQFYEDEIFADFEILDDDADIHPFNDSQQKILYSFLTGIAGYLEAQKFDDDVANEIIEETIELRDNIPNLTKKNVAKKLSRLFAKIKRFKLVTFNEVYDVAKKEVIKYLLKEGTLLIQQGASNLPKLIDHISTILPH